MYCLKLTPYRRKRPWVARIVGFDPDFGLARKFQRSMVDWSTEGPEHCFMLEPGEVYEVMDPGAERFYCRITRSIELERIGIDEVQAAIRLMGLERKMNGAA